LAPVNRRTVKFIKQKFDKNESKRYFLPRVVQRLPKNPSAQKNFTNTLGLKTDGLITELCKKIKSDIVGKNVFENH